MHVLWAYLYHMFGQGFSSKAHEQFALEGSHVLRGMVTRPLCYGRHMVARRCRSFESLFAH
jgi:hypothetical protein